MKTTAKITVLFIALGMALASCVREPSPVAKLNEGLPVAITLGANSSGSSGHLGDAQDRKITSLRVLVYNNVSNPLAPGKLVINHPVLTDENNDPINWANDPLLTKLEVLTGTYDFVFIANELGDPADYSDDSMRDKLDALQPDDSNTNSIAHLNTIEFEADAFQRSKPIPMVTVVRGVQVVNNNHVVVNGTAYTSVWPVALERIGVRLDVNLSLTARQVDALTSGDVLQVAGLPSGAWLFPHNESNFVSSAPARSLSIDPSTGFIDDPDIAGNKIKKFTYILPERILRDGDNLPVNAMLLSTLGKSGKVHWLNDDSSPNYSFHRNLYLDLTATVLESAIVFKDIKIIDWDSNEVRMTDRGIVIPQAGIHASPGVLGVNSRTGRLTLRGSSEYAGTEVAANSEFGPLEADPVYVAYFKWGSLIATGINPEKTAFDNSDIIWAPDEYNVTQLLKDIGKPMDQTGRTAAWGMIRSAYEYDGTYKLPETDAAQGMGDPCAFADKGDITGKYVMYKRWGDGVFVGNSSSNQYWTDQLKASLPGGIHTDDWSMFLPIVKGRDPNGGINTGEGGYWGNSYIGDTDPIYGNRINFDNSMVNIGHRETNRAFAIRCVK